MFIGKVTELDDSVSELGHQQSIDEEACDRCLCM